MDREKRSDEVLYPYIYAQVCFYGANCRLDTLLWKQKDDRRITESLPVCQLPIRYTVMEAEG